ncbi:MAG: 2,3-bisphosphoglycerate-independent phosphoglycerate mutase [Oscillospiraceae bacterium]
MKTVIVIGDGMADNPVEALGGKTPLEAADIPVMDALAGAGEVGHAQTVPRGVPPGSDTAILSIFGYDPRQYFSGRAPLEAAGAGVPLKAGDVAYRCNMVALEDGEMPFEEKKILSHSGGSVEGEVALALMDALLGDARFAACAEKHGVRFYPSDSFRHIAVQGGAEVKGLATVGPHDHLGQAQGGLLPTGCAAAAGLCELMALAHEILQEHPLNAERRRAGKLPANGLWFWAQGVALGLPSFEKEHGVRGFVVSAVPLVQGIGALAGMDVVCVPGATGELDTNYEGKANAVVKGLADGYDFALLHVEAPDECTHNGDTPGKLQAIEWLDSRCIARVVAGLREAGEAFRILVLSDHKTLTSTRGHDGDPVPYILYKSDAEAHSGRAYTEREAEMGPYIPAGHRLVRRLLG